MLCRVRAYVADAAMSPDDTVYVQLVKYWAREVYGAMSIILEATWTFRSAIAPLKRLAQYEYILHKVSGFRQRTV